MPRPSSLSLTSPPVASKSTVSSTVTSPSDHAVSGVPSPLETTATGKATRLGGTTDAQKASLSVKKDTATSAGGARAPQQRAGGLTDTQYSSEPHSPVADEPASPGITSLPAIPPSPIDRSKRSKESTKNFFANLKAAGRSSSNKTQNADTNSKAQQQHQEQTLTRESRRAQGGQALQKSMYSLRKGPGSTPDLSLSNLDINTPSSRGEGASSGLGFRDRSRGSNTSGENLVGNKSKHSIPRRPVPQTSTSDTSIDTGAANDSHARRQKPRFSNLIGRTRPTRSEEGGSTGRSSAASNKSAAGAGKSLYVQGDISEEEGEESVALMGVAPQQSERSLRDVINTGGRGRSADRQSANQSSENVAPRRQPFSSSSISTHQAGPSALTSGMSRDGAGTQLFAHIKDRSTRAADGLGKAGKGFFSKMNRRGSNTSKEDEPYVIRTINMPLVQQTRKTRIAGRLEDSKDKTEFWMPALPWRCIDYLNYRGCEEEGLYRVPGSDVQVRHWQRRFDQEGDINLFNEPELYDINIIGSLFKAWLRELPTEILPKATQAKVARECPNAETVPQLLKDELSMLPPWNYYLLFAITCHLSLLTAYAEKNKMTFSNLCICFQPALKVDAYCFNFLVQHWRECWQGCYTEKEALEDEYRTLDGLASSSGESSNEASHPDDRSAMPPHPQQRQQRGAMVPTTSMPLLSSSTPEPPSSSGGRSATGRPSPAFGLARAGDEAPPGTPASRKASEVIPGANSNVGQQRQAFPANVHQASATNAQGQQQAPSALDRSKFPELLDPVKPVSPLLTGYSGPSK